MIHDAIYREKKYGLNNLILKLYYLLIGLLAFSTTESQTCIICVKTKTAIYVAADSRIVTTNFSDGSKIMGQTCKINFHGEYNFAYAGRYIDDMKDVAATAAKKNTNLKELAFNIRQTFLNRLNDSVTKKAKANYALFKTSIEGRTNLCQILIFGSQNDSLVRYHIRYQIKLNDINKSLTVDAIMNQEKDLPVAYSFGNNAAIASEIANKKEWTGKIQDQLNYLIEKQIKADSINVGKPINIRMLNTKGSKWIQRKVPCDN